ncbi:MAG: transglutaminase family protein [Pseudomonadota bacterium]
MRLAVRHVTRYAYAPAALRAALRLRLWPSRHDTQIPEGWTVSVNGAPVAPLMTDAWGEPLGLWHAHDPVEEVEIVAEGVVETGDGAGVLSGLDRCRAVGVYLRASPLTEPDDALAEFAQAVKEEAEKLSGPDQPLAALHALNHAVREAVDYRPGATDADTTAARALALGAGVCQDHAHVFLACARAMGAPARYVAGYLLAADPADRDAEDGDEVVPDAHETHAWVEAHVPGLGWVGFDPSNRVCPTDRYIRLASGLDARDAAPIRGSVSGQTEEALEAEVSIAPASQSQTQTQQ